MALTPKQEAFAIHFALMNNSAEAARMAGYSHRSAKQLGSRLTKVDQIQRLVTERRQQDAIKLELKKEHIVAGLLESVQLSREKSEPMPMIRSLVELAKLCGFYDPQVVKVPLSGEAERIKKWYATASDDELLAIMTVGTTRT